MICPHIIHSSQDFNKCLLGFYGGRPNHNECARCIASGSNNPDFAAKIKSLPPLGKQASTLGKALTSWTRSGFTATPPEILAEREATCRACPEWDAKALNGTGRCHKCGCSTWAKLRMATERCPLGKWEAAPSRFSKDSEARPI